MKHIMIGVAALLLTGAVHAQDMPRYDVEGYCKEVASFGGEYSSTTYNGCIQMEQSGYNSLKDDWASLPGRVRRYCNEVARFGGAGSYSTLQGCVQMEVSAEQNKSEFSFD